MKKTLLFLAILFAGSLTSADRVDRVFVKYADGAIGTLPVREGETVDDAIRRIALRSDIARVEVDQIVRTFGSLPNDPKLSEQTNLADANVFAAWTTSQGSAGVEVCLVDTGIDAAHPDLAQRIDRSRVKNAIDPFATVQDLHGHGTWVAGVIGAAGNDGIGISGVAQDVRFAPCVFSDAFGYGYLSDAVRCVDWCQNISDILVAAWGVRNRSIILAEAIERYGGVVVAAHEENETSYPADLNFTHVVSTRTLSAPSSNVLTTTLDGGYDRVSGSSVAAGHIAGAAALLLAYAPGTLPSSVVLALVRGKGPDTVLDVDASLRSLME